MLVVGSAVAGVGFILPALLHIALTQTANNSGVSGSALQALAGLDESSWVAFNSGMGVMMLGAAGTLLARKAYPALGWVALVAGIALFLPLADFFALAISGLWITTASILLFRRGAVSATAVCANGHLAASDQPSVRSNTLKTRRVGTSANIHVSSICTMPSVGKVH